MNAKQKSAAKAHLLRAAKIAGTQTELARKVGVKDRSSVTQWLSRGVPLEQCKAIEKATRGQVTRAQLRPDYFG